MGVWWRSARARRATAWLIAVVGILALFAPLATGPEPAGAAPSPLDLARPRILGAGADLAAVARRVTREPYRTMFRRLVTNAQAWTGIPLDDHTIGSERIKARAAKDQAFLYAINRTIAGTEPAPFATPAERQTAGDAARTLLLNMYTRSRLAVPSPLGGTDRDINTSEELLQYSTAYDTLLGARYPFSPADEAAIRTHITDLAAELYLNYTVPTSPGGVYTLVLPNNHRSKSAAALGVAALALLTASPPQGAPPADVRSPAAWLTFAVDQVDLVQRWTFVAPDGGYGEGPYYQRYAAQNLLPFARAWSHANHSRGWDVGGRVIPDLWTSPVYRQTQRWVLDTTLPNGALAPIDDGNVDFSYYFGAAPTTAADKAAFAWRWANAPTPYDTDGSVDLAADSLVAYDDSVVPAPPPGSPTRFATEGGTAVFRSSWNGDATEAVVLGEHGTAMELGRDRDGNGKLASAAHEQPDTGSFTLGAYGQKLLLDPGYMTYEQRSLVGKAPDHNLVLVNGQGPWDPFPASIVWGKLDGPPPVDGQATISDTVDTALLDTARVTSRYASTDVSRRFLFVDDAYVVVADALRAAPGTTPTYTWPLHGNGGGTSGGTFARTANGGRWTNGAGRVDVAIAADSGPITFSTRDTNHEGPGRVLLTHTTLDAGTVAAGGSTHGLEVVYPSRAADAAPTVETLASTPTATAIRVVDPAQDRIVTVLQASNGWVALQDTKLDGTPRVLYADTTTQVGGAQGQVSTQASGPLGLRVGATTADVYAPRSDRWFQTDALPFRPRRADGACRLVPTGGRTKVQAGWDGAVTLRAGAGNSAPAADAGPDVDDVAVGTSLRLQGRGCDVDGDRLTPRWEVVAAPPGSAWTLGSPTSWTPTLRVDAPGPYRVRLTVSDGHGGVSRVSDVEVSGGPRCSGDRLAWSDPRCG